MEGGAVNPHLAFDIVELALSLARDQATGSVKDHAATQDTLLEIVRKIAEAWKQHSGEPLDPSLIRPEDPL
jgi:hypothetical protein